MTATPTGSPLDGLAGVLDRVAGQVDMRYTLEDCIVTLVAPGGSAGGEVKPLESVNFAYGKIKWEYTPIDHTGKPGSATDRTWNLETNKQD